MARPVAWEGHGVHAGPRLVRVGGPAHIAKMDGTITVNGKSRALPPGQTVGGLLTALGLDRRKVAVERNAAIISRSTYDSAVLAAADRIEIVHFIGGG